MAQIGILENGLRRSKAKRNPARRRSTGTAKKNPGRRRSISLASAKAVLKRNGLKATSLANGRRHHKRRHVKRHHRGKRNGIVTRTRNGILGNTKGEVKQVGALVGGALLTKLLGQVVNGFAAPYLAQFGAGNYSSIICDLVAAVVVVPFAISKVIRDRDAAKHARLGGLTVVALDVIGKFAPSFLQYNPFTTAPVVLTASGPAINPATVAQLAQGVANSANPAAAAAKVGSAMAALASGVGGRSVPAYTSSGGGPVL